MPGRSEKEEFHPASGGTKLAKSLRPLNILSQDGKWQPYLIITLIGAVLFLPFLGHAPLFDWDEINFAESAREMLVTHNFSRVQINFQPFWEKPPLFIWLQAFSMSVFGINGWAARLPNALCGMATLLILFHTGKRYFNERFGWLWVMVYAGSFLPHLYFKSGIIDPVFNLFIFLGLLQLIRVTGEVVPKARYVHSAWAGLFIGLAVLTKGPVGLLMPLLCMVMMSFWKKKFSLFKVTEVLLFLFLVVVVSSLWYGLETIKNGPWFLKEFFAYQMRLLTTEDSSHGGPFWYHFVVLLAGCFPASFFIFLAFRNRVGDTSQQQDMKGWMIALLVIILVVFSLVKTKIIHYSSLAYFPLTFLATYTIYNTHLQRSNFLKLTILASILMGLLMGTALFLLPVMGNHTDWLLPYVKDAFARECLSLKMDWPIWSFLPGAGYILAVLIAGWLCIRNKINKAIIVLFISTALVVEAGAVFFAKRIAEYSQGPEIEFFKEQAGKEVYLNVMGYKSYAPYFYGQKQPWALQSPELRKFIQAHTQGRIPDGNELITLERAWQMIGKIDKAALFCCKVTTVNDALKTPGMKEIGRKGGFVFFERLPTPIP